MPKLLALPAPASEDDKVPQVICGIDLRTRKLEPAGHAFHDVHERPVIEAKQGGRKKAATGREPTSDDEAEEAGKASWKNKRKQGGDKRGGSLKLSPQLEGTDLYELLGVTVASSTDQIKKQYRKLVLQHHPDKQQADAGGAAGAPADGGGLNEKELHFVKIQEAYEILSDDSKRRQYDSTLPFDDEVPEDVDESLGGFYGTFAPVFQRNARWSTKLPVPELGNDKTDINKVHKFYDFWFAFDSFRDFSMHDEYNLEDAEFREERRWMERQNQKIRKEYYAAERRRIMKLVETAERLDPRIRAEKEEKEAKKREEKERRARAKQEEEEAKRRQEEERKRREEQEKAEREERERVEREQRKQDKQASKALRQGLKKCIQSKCSFGAAEMEEIQEFCLALEASGLEDLRQRLEATKKAAAAEALMREELKKWHQRRAEEKEEQDRQRQEARRLEEQKALEAKGAAAAAATGAPWSTEELGLLAKGLQKFPGGMGGRWALVTQLLHSAGFPRTEQEVVAQTKELSQGQSLRSMGSRVSTENSFQAPKAKAAPAKAAPEKPAAPSEQAAAGSSGEKGPAPASAEWTPEQQKSLEAALQKHPASMDKNERWRLIAEAVPGRTKAQCVERFKFLREQLAKGKTG